MEGRKGRRGMVKQQHEQGEGEWVQGKGMWE